MSVIETSSDVADWRIRAQNRYLGVAYPAESPQAVVIAGRAAAGKGIWVEELCREFAAREGCAVIDRNELLLLHPDFAGHLVDPPAQSLETARRQAAELVCDLLDDAISHRLNIVLETALADPDELRRQLHELHVAGYAVIFVALHVLPEAVASHAGARRHDWRDQVGIARPDALITGGIEEADFDVHLEQFKHDLSIDRFILVDAGGAIIEDSSRRTPTPVQSTAKSESSAAQRFVESSAAAPIDLGDGRKLRLGNFTSARPESHHDQPRPDSRLPDVHPTGLVSPIPPMPAIPAAISPRDPAPISHERIAPLSGGPGDPQIERRRRLQLKLRQRVQGRNAGNTASRDAGEE